jgi:hypothetical protein
LVPTDPDRAALLDRFPGVDAVALFHDGPAGAGFDQRVFATEVETALHDLARRIAAGELPRPAPAWPTFRRAQDATQQALETMLEGSGDGTAAAVADARRGAASRVPGGGYVATLERELREARGTIDDMRKSPFWRARGRVLRLLALLGRGRDA